MSKDLLETLFQGLNPRTSEGADMIIDLRQALLSKGHPGLCVRCFFGLMGDLGQKGALLPLRNWLEDHLEMEVMAGEKELEILPIVLNRDKDLEGFCQSTMKTMREDRVYSDNFISLRFRYKAEASK